MGVLPRHRTNGEGLPAPGTRRPNRDVGRNNRDERTRRTHGEPVSGPVPRQYVIRVEPAT
jgi:hypothetical protein